MRFLLLFTVFSLLTVKVAAQSSAGQILYPERSKLATLIDFITTERPTDVTKRLVELMDDKPDKRKEGNDRIYSGRIGGVPVGVTLGRKSGTPRSITVADGRLFGTTDHREQVRRMLPHRLWRGELEGGTVHTDPVGGKLLRFTAYPGKIAAKRVRIGDTQAWRFYSSYWDNEADYEAPRRAIGKMMMSDANYARICEQMEQTFSAFGTIDLSTVPGQCYGNCNVIINDNEPFYYFGNVLYNGGHRGGLPYGRAIWAVVKECSRSFKNQTAHLVAVGRFEDGRPTGWHKITMDTLLFEGRFEDGQITEVRDYPVGILPGIDGKFSGKVVNGELISQDATITNGETVLNPKLFTPDGQLTGSHTLVARDGAIHKVTLGKDGRHAWHTTVSNEAGTWEHRYFLDDAGNKTDQQLTIHRGWDLPVTDGPQRPTDVVVTGNFIADVVNRRFAGKDLTVEMLNERITLRGDFINPSSYQLITLPAGTHQMTRPDGTTLTGNYKNGRYQDGEEVYALPSLKRLSAPAFNLETLDRICRVPAGEKEFVIPVDYVGGLAFAHWQWGEYEVRFAYLDANGEVLQAFKKIVPEGEIESRYLAGLISSKVYGKVAGLRINRDYADYTLNVLLYK